MIRLPYYLCFLLIPFVAFGQGEFDQWRFGYNAGVSFSTSPSFVTGSAISASEGSATVSNCDGELLFYTDGMTVWGSDNSMMTNGYDLRGSGASYPSTQAALIVKRPKSQSIYYIFTSSDIYGVNYSVVNMLANSGKGEVIQKNVQVSSSPTQKLGVTYHANGEDIWVITHYEKSRVYEAFLITPTGVSSNTVKSVTGPEHRSAHGDLKVNQQGTKIAAVVQDDHLVTLADFDNSTGQVKNAVGVVNNYKNPHGCEFSPTGNYMYVTAWGNPGGIFQFAVNSNNSVTLNSSVNIAGSFTPNGSLQLGPNNKIYVAHVGDAFFSNRYLGVINAPDNAGTSANFNKNGLYLGSSGASSWQLPNATLTNDAVVLPQNIVATQFCLSDPTEFSLDNADDVLDVLWNFDDPSSGVSNFSSAINTSHQFSAAGTYNVSVEVTTSCEVITLVRQVIIEDFPVLNFDSLNVCPDAQTNISANNQSGVSYSWTPVNGLSNPNVINPDYNSQGLSDTSIVFYIEAAFASGCSSIDTLEINISRKYLQTDTFYVCPGFGTQLSLDSSIVSASWTASNGITDLNSLTPYVSPSSSRYYSVIVTDSNNCSYADSVFSEVKAEVPVDAGLNQIACFGDTVVFGTDVSPDSALYSWSPINDFIVNDSMYGVAIANSSKWYYVEVSKDTCSNIDSVFLNVNPLPLVSINQSDSSICIGDSMLLSANAVGNYAWFENNNMVGDKSTQWFIMQSAAEIILEVTDSNGCVGADSITLSALKLPEIELSSDSAICFGDSIMVSVSGAPNYSWFSNQVFISNDSVLRLLPTASVQYTVEATGGNGCKLADSLLITVNPLPVINMTQDSLICKNSVANLWATGGVVYDWYPKSSVLNNTSSSAQAFPSVNTTYKVVVQTSFGCVDSSVVDISLNDVPEASFDYDLLPVCEGVLTNFTNSSTLATGYNWVFGDGSFSTAESPSRIFEYGSSNTVVLIANNNNVCFDTASVSFNWDEAKDAIEVLVPNIITPNNDGTNDCFEYTFPKEFDNCTSFQLFNRWGLMVFDSSEFGNSFCGVNAFNNKTLSAGTYFYVLKVGEYSLNGFLTIQR